jgi:hypothetical protein
MAVIDLETHEAVFTWMRQRLADAGLVKEKTVGIDATTQNATGIFRVYGFALITGFPR